MNEKWIDFFENLIMTFRNSVMVIFNPNNDQINHASIKENLFAF